MDFRGRLLTVVSPFIRGGYALGQVPKADFSACFGHLPSFCTSSTISFSTEYDPDPLGFACTAMPLLATPAFDAGNGTVGAISWRE